MPITSLSAPTTCMRFDLDLSTDGAGELKRSDLCTVGGVCSWSAIDLLWCLRRAAATVAVGCAFELSASHSSCMSQLTVPLDGAAAGAELLVHFELSVVYASVSRLESVSGWVRVAPDLCRAAGHVQSRCRAGVSGKRT